MVRQFNSNISVAPHKQTPKLTFFLILLAFIMSMRCWMGFNGRLEIFTYIFPILLVLSSIQEKVRFEFKKRYVLFAILVFMVRLYESRLELNLVGNISMAFPALCILLILSISDNEKPRLLVYIIKWFGLFILAGIVLYLLSFVVDLPSFGEVQATYGSNFLGDNYKNYIVYIKRVTTDGFPRFNSAFIEAGDVGCVASFLLFAANFDFKRYQYLWAILAGLILSFSLAGYFLALLGYLFSVYNSNRISLRNIIIISVVLFSVFTYGRYANIGFLNDLIYSRLEMDEDTGIVGNNRATLLMYDYYEAMFNDRSVLLFGYDTETVAYIKEKARGAGFISQVLSTGLVGFFGLCFPFLLFFLSSKNRKYACLFFLLFLFYMYQRTNAFWFSIVLCYVYGIVINEREKV